VELPTSTNTTLIAIESDFTTFELTIGETPPHILIGGYEGMPVHQKGEYTSVRVRVRVRVRTIHQKGEYASVSSNRYLIFHNLIPDPLEASISPLRTRIF